jgi:hypothetical protein
MTGEIRLSDFCLWQTMTSCVYFCRVLWPDFSIVHLLLSIIHYQQNFAVIQQRRKIVNEIKKNYEIEHGVGREDPLGGGVLYER